jgi:DNA polymerase-3 subunit gamma/tau
MALLRIIHASSLPDPADLVRKLTERADEAAVAVGSIGDGGRVGSAVMTAAPLRAKARADLPPDFPALVALMEASREPRLAHALAEQVRLVDYTPPALTIVAPGDLGPGFAAQLAAALGRATATRWTVTLARAEDHHGGAPTLHEAAEARVAAERAAALADPRVREILAAFPEATLIAIDADPDSDPLRSSADA